MSCTIRRAVREDVPIIHQFIRALASFEKLEDEVVATKESLTASLFSDAPEAHVLLAEIEGSPVGFALYFYNYSTFIGKRGLYVEDVFVADEYRGCGIGNALFHALAAIALEDDCGRMEWWVLDWNRKAIDFYSSLGAVPMDEWTVYRLSRPALEALGRSKP